MKKQYQAPDLLLFRLSDITTGDGVITPSTDILPYNYYEDVQDADLYAEQNGDDA